MTTIDGVLVAMPPPEGYVVNFNNPKRQSVMSIYVISGIGMVLAAFMMGQRLYVKARIRRKLGVDDLLLVITWLGTLAIQGLIIFSIVDGFLGVHAWEIPFDKMQKFALYAGYLNSIVYTVPTTLAKIVILLFFRDINNPQKWYKYSVWGMIFVVGASGVAILFASTLSCHPFEKNYDLLLAEVGDCIDRKAMYQATAGLGVATDVLIFLIPVPMVLSLKMSRSKKVGLLIMFAVGSATVITSMVRLALLISSLNELDQTWGGGPICLWVCVEANLLIMCASLSTLNQFIKVVAPKLVSSIHESTKKGSKSVSSHRHELHTFGSGAPKGRAYYNRFDDNDLVTDTIIDIEGHPPKSSGDVASQTSNDDGSDRGIVQTKETHVYYEYS
ncbi:hypothetical protein PT974_05600 [Cladobotryum mycophilum]|uniref:Rhodopsin domain-containing protein n=1 Tax=Cladobotryum mycophilum TaxID=491253 RepID=A0ABR0SJ71_9HYPO